jgi:aspartate kinase
MKTNELIVCKFGGTSLASVDNIKRVVEIIKSDPRRRIIVVSAPGKRDANDTKMTDTLFDIFYRKEKGEDFDKAFNEFAQRFYDIQDAFKAETNLREIMEEFRSEIKTGSADFITSTGEYFMAKVMAAILGFEFIDIDKTHAISFKVQKQPRPAENKFVVDLKKSRKKFKPFRKQNVVIPGFYGVTPYGSIYTFPRGGSDITGAIIANIADANIYENWTDVDGVFDRDPNKHKDAKHFPEISYAQIEELARNGANVLHPDAIEYARVKNIPIHLKNTFNPSGEGTVIK